MDSIYQQLISLIETGRRGVLATVVSTDGHTPQVVGAKMLVEEDGTTTGTIGGGQLEHAVIQRALETFKEQSHGTVESFHLSQDLGMCCGGKMDIFLEPVLPKPMLYLFGAGHVAQPTARLATEAGFQVEVIDDRPEWNTPSRFPTAQQHHQLPYEDFLATFQPGSTDYVVIVTQGHEYDQRILDHCLAYPCAYLGMIGSTRKVAKTQRHLRPKSEWQCTPYAPIGLDIRAETPIEIAVSIVGELIREKRKKDSPKTTTGSFVASRATEQHSPQEEK